jgi:hypothetical protein
VLQLPAPDPPGQVTGVAPVEEKIVDTLEQCRVSQQEQHLVPVHIPDAVKPPGDQEDAGNARDLGDRLGGDHDQCGSGVPPQPGAVQFGIEREERADPPEPGPQLRAVRRDAGFCDILSFYPP